MADENIIIDVYGKAVGSSFVKAGEEGSKIAQQAFRPIQVDADFSKLVAKLGSSKSSFNQLTESTRDFGDSLERGLSRITALGAASGALFGIVRAFESSIQAARNLEASLKDINVILNLPSDKLQDFGRQLFDVARQTKQSFSEVAKSAQEFSRQGLDAAQTIERTRAALLLSNLASIDSVKATETITAAINSFSKENLNAIEIVNKLVAVDAKFAVSSADLAEALTRVGSTAQEAGVGFDKLIALVTGAQQITQRGGSVIGNALNTIFSRLKREDTLNALEQLGIQVREVEKDTGRFTGALVPADRILTQLAERFKTLTQEQRANVAEQVAGVRQGNILAGVFSGLGIAQEAYVTSVKASDEALQRQGQLLQTQDARIKNLGTSFQQLGANVANVGFGDLINKELKGLTEGTGGGFAANLGGQLIKAFSGTGDEVGNEFAKVFIKSVSDILTGPGLITIGLIGIKIAQVLSEFAGKSFKNVNLFSNGDAELQKNISASLGTQVEKAALILRTENDKVVAEEKILQLIKEQNVLYAEAASLRGSLGAIVNSPQAKTLLSQRNIGNAANGLVDAVSREQSAISQGVGGASSTAKPVFLKDFNGGAAVANTDEYLVKNYHGRGKDAIFNQEMVKKYGIPENSIKIGEEVNSQGLVFKENLSNISSKDVLRKTSAPIGKLLSSGKFSEEQLLKFLDIRNLFDNRVNNYATDHTLKLTRTGIIQRQLPTGELTRPSPEFLEEAHQHYRRSEIEGILRTFEQKGEYLTENKFLQLTRENQRLFPLKSVDRFFANGYVENLATGDEALTFIQNIIRELSTGAQRLSLENKAPFAQNQLAVVPPTSLRPSIPSIDINARLQNSGLLLENKLPATINAPFAGITSTQTNAALSPQLFAGQEQERLRLQTINQRAFLSQQPKPFQPLEAAPFEIEGSRRRADNAKFSSGIDQAVRTISNFDKDLVESSSVLKKLVNASNLLQEQYINGEKTQAEFNKVSARLNQSIQGEIGRLVTSPSVQPSLSLEQANAGRFALSPERRERIGRAATNAAFVIPFAGEAAISGLTNSLIGDDITRSRVQRGASTALSGLSSAAFIASLAPNPVGLTAAAGAAAIGVGKGAIEAFTESPEERAQKLDRFVKEIGLQRDAIERARGSIVSFQNALDDSTVTEKQRVAFQKEALSATRGVNDAGLASVLRRQILGRDFSSQANEGVESAIQKSFANQEKQIALSPESLRTVFDKAAQESTTRTSLGFRKPAEGISTETSNANLNIVLQDILSRKTPEEQAGRAQELAKNSEDAIRTIKNITPAFTNNFSVGLSQSDQSFRVAAQIAASIEKALTPEQLQANQGRIQQIREVRGNVQDQIKFFADLLSSQSPKLRQQAEELTKINQESEKFRNALDLTGFSLQKLSEFSLRDIERGGQTERARNQRVISQQGEIQVARNFGVGGNEIQFREFANNISNANLNLGQQRTDLARQFSSQFTSQVLAQEGTKVRGVLPNGEAGFKNLVEELGNTTDIDKFTERIKVLQDALEKGGPEQKKLADTIESIGRRAKDADASLKEATNTEVARNKALLQNAILVNQLNPNKAESIGAIGQQINQSRFLTGLAPQTTNEIDQANKEKLSSLNSVFNLVKGLGGNVGTEFEEQRGELAKKTALSDLRNAQNRLTDIPLDLQSKSLIRDTLRNTQETIESKTGSEVLNFSNKTNNVSELSDIVKEINGGELVKTLSDVSKNGIQLKYDNTAIPVDGQLTLTLNATQINALSQNIFDSVLANFGDSIKNITAKLDAHADNLKAVNKEVGVAIPPKAQ